MKRRVGKGFEEFEWKPGEDPMMSAVFREGMIRHAESLRAQGIGTDEEHRALIEAIEAYPASPDARSASKQP